MKKNGLLVCLVLVMAAASAATAQVSWTNRFHGYGYDWVTAIAPDGAGGVYVTGASASNSYSDFLTIRYASSGTAVWTNRYHGPFPTQEDIPVSIAVDHNGNLFVSGTSHGTNGRPDFLTISYTADGAPRWTNRYNGLFNWNDNAKSMAVDSAGNVFVTGSSTYPANSVEYTTIKYSNDGIPSWTNRFSGVNAYYDVPSAMVVDNNDDVIITGTAGASGFVQTVKYSNSGALLWSLVFSNQYGASAYDIAADKRGNTFVIGQAASDFFTVKYSREGTPIWTNYLDGSGNDRAYAVEVDPAGDVIVTGALSYNGSPMFATAKYSKDGAPQWTNIYRGPMGSDRPATNSSALAVDRQGNIYVTGSSQRTTDGIYYDYLTIKYSSSGMPLWTNRYNGTGNYEDRATAVAVDSELNVFVAGHSDGVRNHYTYQDFATVKYAGHGTAPALHVQPTVDRIVLFWTNSTFMLQAAPEAAGPFTNIIGAKSPFTNVVSGFRQFFRLVRGQ